MTDSPQEFYSLNNTEAQVTYISTRRAKDWVPFLLPHLQPGMSLLDCGCGIGTITLDLAELVAPGQVIGVDMDNAQLEIARASAQQRGLTNVTFEQGNVYELRFAATTFDIVNAHTLLYHLSDQLRAIQEMRRVLKPGGLIAITDDHFDTVTLAPSNPLNGRILEIWKNVVLFNGGNPTYSPNLRAHLRQAGFTRTAGFATAAEHYGTPAETRRMASVIRGQFSDPALATLAISQGWTTQAELNAISAWLNEWGSHPDAFMAIMYCGALGWNE
jgi:ubiquinone/menaquinone biosynthesis C-methylase UbiE